MGTPEKEKNEYNWLDDPFVEKPEEQLKQGMGSSSKLFVGCGCLIVLVVMVILVVLFFASLSDFLMNS